MTVVVCFTATVKSGAELEFEQVMAELVPIMKAGEPDLLDLIWGKAEDPSTYTLVETFKDYAALEFHRASPQEREFAPRMIRLIENAHKSIFFPR